MDNRQGKQTLYKGWCFLFVWFCFVGKNSSLEANVIHFLGPPIFGLQAFSSVGKRWLMRLYLSPSYNHTQGQKESFIYLFYKKNKTKPIPPIPCKLFITSGTGNISYIYAYEVISNANRTTRPSLLCDIWSPILEQNTIPQELWSFDSWINSNQRCYFLLPAS